MHREVSSGASASAAAPVDALDYVRCWRTTWRSRAWSRSIFPRPQHELRLHQSRRAAARARGSAFVCARRIGGAAHRDPSPRRYAGSRRMGTVPSVAPPGTQPRAEGPTDTRPRGASSLANVQVRDRRAASRISPDASRVRRGSRRRGSARSTRQSQGGGPWCDSDRSNPSHRRRDTPTDLLHDRHGVGGLNGDEHSKFPTSQWTRSGWSTRSRPCP